jgi:hypothetical protein
MQIPPISGTSGFSYPQNNPVMDTFYQKWTDWYQVASDPHADPHAVQKLTHDLVHFLEQHKHEFIQATKNTPEPFGPKFTETFPHLIDHTLSSLKAWERHGYEKGQTSMLSEFVSDIYTWCKQAYGG